MDFHGMKRKRLQALCKKHGIPANLKNCEMADRLSFLFKEKEIEDPVGSGDAGTKKGIILQCVSGKNVEMIDLVTPSPGLKEKSVFLDKNLKDSEIKKLEFKIILSPKITREEFGICGVEEDVKSRLNKEHVNSQGGLHLAPVTVALDEFYNHLGEGEVEKLGDKNNLIRDVCENRKGRDQAEELGDHNSPEGSNIKDENASCTSKEESGFPIVEEDNALEQGDQNSSQGPSMKDVKVLHVSQGESGYPVVEKDEEVDQGDHNSYQGSNTKDVNAPNSSKEESGFFPMVEEDNALEQGDHNSSQGPSVKDVKVLHVSQEESGYPMVEEDNVLEQGNHNSTQGPSMKDMKVLHVSQEESGYPMVEEDNVLEQGDHNSTQGPSMKDMKVLHVSQEESGYPMVEKDEDIGDHNSPQGSNTKDVNASHSFKGGSGFPMVEEDNALKQGDHNSSQGPSVKDVKVLHVSQGFPMVEEDNALEQGDHNSSQGPSMKDVKVLHVSKEESGYPVVENDEDVEQGDHNNPQGSNIKDVNSSHASKEVSDFPMVEEDNALEQGDYNNSQGPSMKDVNVLHVSQEESDYPIVEDVGVEQGDNSIPQGPNMKDMNVLHISQEESSYPIVEEDVAAEQGDQNSSQGPNMKEVNALHVCLEESGYPMVEEEEVVEQGDHNSPQGSNLKYVNVMHVSEEEFGYPMAEDVQKSDDNICNPSCNLIYTGSEVDAKSTDGKTNLTAEHSADDVPSSLNKYLVGTPDQFQRSYPENEVESGDLNIHQDTCEEDLKSPQKTGSITDPVECIEFSPYNLEASVVESFQSETCFDPSTLGHIGTCNMKESMQSYKMEKVEYSQETLQPTANVNLLHKSMDECNMHIGQGEVIGLFDNSNVHDDDAVNRRSEVDTRCLDISIRAINNVGKTNMTVEQFTDELQSSTFEDSDGTPVQFLSNDALSEAKFDFNIHEMVVSGTAMENVDMSEAKFVSSRKISLSPDSERMIDFSPKQLNNSETKVLLSETKIFPETARVDNGIGDAEDNMQLDVNKEQVDDSQQVIHAAASVMDLNDEDFVQVAFDEVGDYLLEGEIEKSGLIANSEEVDIGIRDVEDNMQININEKQVDESQEVTHLSSSVMVLSNVDLVQVALEEIGDHLSEGEVEKSDLNADSEECIGFLPNNLQPSATKGFQDETYFDRSKFGDVETSKVEERIPSDQMEKENSQEVLHMENELILLPRSTEESDLVHEEVTRLFNKSDDHEDVGVTGVEDGKIQMTLNDFHSIDDASGQNSDENAPTMSHHGEMKLCTFNLQQMSASGTFSGDELETPPECTPIPKLRESSIKKELKIVSSLPVKRARDIDGASDMKENIKISKKEQVGTIISRSAFPKRKPLQDLQQN